MCDDDYLCIICKKPTNLSWKYCPCSLECLEKILKINPDSVYAFFPKDIFT